jgi:hypothetical protein
MGLLVGLKQGNNMNFMFRMQPFEPSEGHTEK